MSEKPESFEKGIAALKGATDPVNISKGIIKRFPGLFQHLIVSTDVHLRRRMKRNPSILPPGYLQMIVDLKEISLTRV